MKFILIIASSRLYYYKPIDRTFDQNKWMSRSTYELDSIYKVENLEKIVIGKDAHVNIVSIFR